MNLSKLLIGGLEYVLLFIATSLFLICVKLIVFLLGAYPEKTMLEILAPNWILVFSCGVFSYMTASILIKKYYKFKGGENDDKTI